MQTMTAPINEERLNHLLGKAIVDFGAASHAALVVIGDKLGLYKALAEAGPLTPEELAARTDTAERYVREWLNSQAAGGYVDYDPATAHYSMSAEQAMLLAHDDSPAFMVGAFQTAVAASRIAPRLQEAFRTGQGIGYHLHDADVFPGIERLFRTSYATYLVQAWIPSLTGVEEKLRAGAVVADVGCGHGAATIMMAEAYPRSTFVGFDYHLPSVHAARDRARSAGVDGRVRFEVGGATAFDTPSSGAGYDLVTSFDSLHDLGDPIGAAERVLATLAPDGTWMIVEPYAADRVEDNLNPIGRAFYSASTLICTPCSLSQETGLALGGQAGEAMIRDVASVAGFTRFRRAAQTPFNLVFEARA